MPADDQGISIALSPVQLAAILLAETLVAHQKLVYRVLGTAQLFGSALEMGAGVLLELAPDPTLLTKVGGGVLIAHGADSGWAAGKQVWSGTSTKDYTQILGEKLASGFGSSKNAAEWTGMALDVAVPLGATAAVAVERIASIEGGKILLQRSPKLDLLEHETVPGGPKLGHTLERHVDKPITYLESRNIEVASTFFSKEVAEQVISDALRANRNEIRVWAMNANSPRLALTFEAKSPVGRCLIRSTGQMVQAKKIVLILKRARTPDRVFFILTAYPEP